MKFEEPPWSSSESFPEKNPEGDKKSFREKIFFPHVKPIIALLEKQFKGTEKAVDAEAMEDILYAFLEQRIEWAGVYHSEQQEAAFPWGVTDTGELAKKLYSRYAGEEVGDLEPNPGKKKKEFLFTSLQLIQSGSQFALMEEALHQAIKDLPGALDNIKEGKEPDSNEVYTLGSPTNEMGSMSEAFLERTKGGKAFDAFGSLYAEFIKSAISNEEKDRTEIFLYGESMAASFATGTAEHLLEDGVVTQSREETEKSDIPFLRVRLDMPVGSSDLSQERKRWQIPVGFLAQVGYTGVTDSYIRSIMTKDKAFLSSAEAMFKEQGMVPDMSEEQVALKKEGIKEALHSLREGTPVPKDLKVTKVVGTADPLLYSRTFNKKAKEHKEEYRGTLGQNIVPSAENERTFGIKMTHAMPYFRENELERMRRAALKLKEIKKKA